MVIYDRDRRRIYLCGARIHHGGVGLVLIALGLALLVDDIHDWPFSIRDS